MKYKKSKGIINIILAFIIIRIFISFIDFNSLNTNSLTETQFMVMLFTYFVSGILIYQSNMKGFLVLIATLLAETFSPALSFYYSISEYISLLFSSEVLYFTIFNLVGIYLSYTAYTNNLGRKKFDYQFLALATIVISFIWFTLMFSTITCDITSYEYDELLVDSTEYFYEIERDGSIYHEVNIEVTNVFDQPLDYTYYIEGVYGEEYTLTIQPGETYTNIEAFITEEDSPTYYYPEVACSYY